MTPRTWQSNVRRKQRVNQLQRKPRRNVKRQHANRRVKRRERARPRVRKQRVRKQRVKKLRVVRKRLRARRAPARRAHANRPVRRRPEKRHRVARQLAGRKLRKHNLTGVFYASCESLMRLAFFFCGGTSALTRKKRSSERRPKSRIQRLFCCGIFSAERSFETRILRGPKKLQPFRGPFLSRQSRA